MHQRLKLSLITLLLTIFIYLVVYFTVLRFLFYGLDHSFLYYFKGLLNNNINQNIVVVEIDERTFNTLGFPLSRDDYIPVIDNLRLGKPAVIGLDILFLDKGKDPDIDNMLTQKFSERDDIIIGFDIGDNASVILPYEEIYKSVSDVGFFLPNVDSYTSKVYSVYPYLKLNDDGIPKYFDAFSFRLIKKYFEYLYHRNIESTYDDNSKSYDLFNKKIPLNDSRFYIYFENQNKYKRLSYLDVYNGNIDYDELKDKIVVIGYTAKGAKDDFYIPGFNSKSTMNGVYVHVNAINNILNDNYIVFFNKYIEYIISFLFIFFIVYINVFYVKNVDLRWISMGALLLLIIIFIIYLGVFWLTANSAGIYLVPNRPFEFIAILFLSFFLSSILKYMNEGKNKRLLSQALSEYVSRDIVNEILSTNTPINTEGETKKITIFFSDVQGFTTISERLTPEELFSFLRVYLRDMSDIILDYKGFINKYEGDAIMALWGVFGSIEKFGALHACYSALIQQQRLDELNEVWEREGKDLLFVRMGIHTGEAMIGNIGAEGRKMEFTALGDSVNLRSRLEGTNKLYNTKICVSRDTYELAKEYFNFRYLDNIKVKGKEIGVDIYELQGFKKDFDLSKALG